MIRFARDELGLNQACLILAALAAAFLAAAVVLDHTVLFGGAVLGAWFAGTTWGREPCCSDCGDPLTEGS